MVSRTVTIQIQHQSIMSLPFHNGVLLGIILPCSGCYPFLGHCDANYSWFCMCLFVIESHHDRHIFCQWSWRLQSHWVCHHGLHGYSIMRGLPCNVSLPFTLCCSGYFFYFEAPAPTASTSPGNLLEMQILSPCSRSAETENWDETQQSVYWQAFQVVRVPKGWWSILGLALIRRYKSKKCWMQAREKWNWGKGLQTRAVAFHGGLPSDGLAERKPGLLLVLFSSHPQGPPPSLAKPNQK